MSLRTFLVTFGIMLCQASIVCHAVRTTSEPVLLPTADRRPQLHPELAYDGTGTFLLVWQQGRNYYETQEGDIFALRLDLSGRPIDRQPMSICVAKGSQERPKVAYSEGQFLVVWHDLRNGRDWDLYAARIKPDGTALDPDGFPVSGGPNNQASAVVASAPSGFLVVWQHYEGRHYQLHGATISGKGEVRASKRLAGRGEPLHGGDLTLARVGDRWLLSWKDERNWSLSDGQGMVVRRFGRIRLNSGTAEVLDVERAPAPTLGTTSGRFVTDGKEMALFAGWGVVGRGRLIPSGAIYTGENAVPLPNPNTEPDLRISGWNTKRAFTLFSTKIQIEGPVAAAYGDGVYLAAAHTAAPAKPPFRTVLFGSRFSPTGTRLDEPNMLPILHESGQPIFNPVLAFGNDAFLLVFEQNEGPGKHRLWSKIVKLQ